MNNTEYSKNELAQQALASLINNQSLTTDDMGELFVAIMQGQVDPCLSAALLVALRMKGETADEILGAAKAMRQLSTKLSLPLNDQPVIDIVGTGGDGANLFNVSTAASFVVANCGGRVAKHCGRGVSSSSGSVDLLTQLGVDIQASLEQQQKTFAESNLVFMPAPNHHPAMRYAIPVRQLLKQRTIFNVLGPLTNPASVEYYLLGVYDESMVELMAKLLGKLGATRALVVHSKDGLDEISIAAPTLACELHNGECKTCLIDPQEIGFTGSLEACRVTSPDHSLRVIKDAINGTNPDAAKQIAINAGAALYVLEVSQSIKEGAEMAMANLPKLNLPG